jgi:hypothetical protein
LATEGEAAHAASIALIGAAIAKTIQRLVLPLNTTPPRAIISEANKPLKRGRAAERYLPGIGGSGMILERRTIERVLKDQESAISRKQTHYSASPSRA